MKTYRFTIYLRGIAVISEDVAEELYRAGCDDCTPGSCDGESYAAFDREADSLESAVASAVANIQSAGQIVDRVQLDANDLAVLSAI
jgi:hypothetical protein